MKIFSEFSYDDFIYYSLPNIIKRMKINKEIPEWSTFTKAWNLSSLNKSVLVLFENDMIKMLENLDLHICLIEFNNESKLIIDYMNKHKKNLTYLEFFKLKKFLNGLIDKFREDFQLILNCQLKTLELKSSI